MAQPVRSWPTFPTAGRIFMLIGFIIMCIALAVGVLFGVDAWIWG